MPASPAPERPGGRRAGLRLGQAVLSLPVVVLGAIGAVLAPRDGLVPVLVAVPMTAAMIAFVLVVGRADLSAPAPIGRAVRWALVAAGVAAASTLVVAGLTVLVGQATGPVLLLVAFGTAVWAWVRYGRTVTAVDVTDPHTCPTEPNPLPGARPLVRVVASLSTPALCGEWQRSLSVLHAATDAAALDDVAGLRRRYLDELERRDPQALARWLAADARPVATSPRRHLSAEGP